MKARAPISLTLGLILVAALCLSALLAPALTPYPPEGADPAMILAPPSLSHPAGTDQLGRDMAARILFGGRASLAAAFGVALLSVGLGLVIGAASGLAGGWVDTAVMRACETIMAAPSLVIALALTAALGPSLLNLVLVLGFLGVPFHVRLFRAEALSLRDRPFMLAARSNGAGAWRLILLHAVPNLGPTAATFGASALGSALVTASALSFIGLGAQPPTPEWGLLIFEGRNTLMYEWWCALLPGLAVALASLGFILTGDGLREWLDPRSRSR